MKYYSASKKEGIFAIHNNMDLPEGYFVTEISQTQKGNYCMISLI